MYDEHEKPMGILFVQFSFPDVGDLAESLRETVLRRVFVTGTGRKRTCRKVVYVGHANVILHEEGVSEIVDRKEGTAAIGGGA